MLRESTIQELQTILKEDFGQHVSREEATNIAQGLVDYFGLMLKIEERTKRKDELNNGDAKIYNGS